MRPAQRASSWAWWALAGAAALAVSWVLAVPVDRVPAFEEDVFRFFNEWPDWLEGPIWPIMQAGAVAIVPASALVVYLAFRQWRPSAALFGAGMVAWVAAKVVKAIVERGRPEALLSDVILRPSWTGLGFVSGHAAVAFALATVAHGYLPRPWRYVVWGIAVATGVLRMYTAAHLPLDVTGGAGLGIMAGSAAHLVLGALDRRRQPPGDGARTT